MARAAKGESWLSHPYNAQALDGHLVVNCDHRHGVYRPLNRLISYSKKPGCFGGCTLGCTGLVFFFGVVVGDGVAEGDGAIVSVGVCVLVGMRVGILVGIFVGAAFTTAFLCSTNCWLNSGWFVSTAGAVYVD